MSKEYILKSTNPSIEAVKSNIIQELNERIGARQDCKVTIQSFDFRGVGALNAYWMMIDRIVAWDAAENGLKKSYFHKQFMEEAKLYEEVDNMPFWKIKHKDKIKEGWEVYHWHDDDAYTLMKWKDEGKEEIEEWISLGRQYERHLCSISNKGDVTKEEMSRLLMTVIKFGDDNIDGWIGIIDTELDNMLRSYDK